MWEHGLNITMNIKLGAVKVELLLRSLENMRIIRFTFNLYRGFNISICTALASILQVVINILTQLTQTHCADCPALQNLIGECSVYVYFKSNDIFVA